MRVDSDDEAGAFTRLLAGTTEGRTFRTSLSVSGLNLQQIFPGVRGQLIRQALGLARQRPGEDSSDDSDANMADDSGI